jgi:SAM-dependent methyltransferase
MPAEHDTVAPGAPDDAFRFGENWQQYVSRYFNPERERIASESLVGLLDTDLTGKYFLDIGAGSGLFSLCAHKLGASRVVSVDVDPESVESCNNLREMCGRPEGWEVLHGSILDPALLDELDPADVVYSWGVLHHTGDMYRAIENASRLMVPEGIFAIAIYNRVTSGFLNSERWLRIKRAYNHSSRPAREAMLALYEGYWFAKELRHRRNPIRTAANYKQSRGMAVRTDLRDWLGGYPYEYATADEVARFCEGLGLRTIKVLPVPGAGTGNNEFVFTARSSSTSLT